MSARRRQLGITLIQVIVIVGFMFLVAVMMFPVTACGCGSPKMACMASVKQLALGVVMYEGDHDGLPIADHWMDEIHDYVKSPYVFPDPEIKRKGDFGRAFRSSASAVKPGDILDDTKFIVVFDSDLMGWNASSELWSLPRPGRHKGSDVVAFADGHAKALYMEDKTGATSAILLADDKSGPKLKK